MRLEWRARRRAWCIRTPQGRAGKAKRPLADDAAASRRERVLPARRAAPTSRCSRIRQFGQQAAEREAAAGWEQRHAAAALRRGWRGWRSGPRASRPARRRVVVSRRLSALPSLHPHPIPVSLVLCNCFIFVFSPAARFLDFNSLRSQLSLSQPHPESTRHAVVQGQADGPEAARGGQGGCVIPQLPHKGGSSFPCCPLTDALVCCSQR